MTDAIQENESLKKEITRISLEVARQEHAYKNSETMLGFLKSEELKISQEMSVLDVKDKDYLIKIHRLTERIRYALIVSEEYFLTGRIPR